MRLAGVLPVLVATGALAFGVASAQASLAPQMSIHFPFEATVGQTGLDAFIRLQNTNGPTDDTMTNAVCNAGDPAPCEIPETGISLVPSCKQVNSDVQCTGADPGVFGLSATGTGRAATACAGVTFNIVNVGDAFGTVRFVPQPPGTHVTLPGPNSGMSSQCDIDFKVDVLKFPVDEQEFNPGTQTTSTGEHTQILGSDHLHRRTVSPGVTISRANTASVATTASANVALGSGTLTDSATVSGLASPQAGSTVEFRLYGPDDATCAGTPLLTSTKTVTVNGSTATATSDAFTPTQTGTYRWVASYSGDANNLAKAGACNDPNESTTVTAPPAPPPPGSGGGGVDPVPLLSAFSFSPAAFKAKAGSRIRFTLSEAASVRVVVESVKAGRRVGGRCRAPARANRKRPKCTRFVRVGAITLAGISGANSAKFDGRVAGRRLAVGKYRATATAVDSAAQPSTAARASFKVKR
jgi:hypothetical protein